MQRSKTLLLFTRDDDVFNAVFVPRLQLNYGCKNDFAKLRFSTLSIARVIIQLAGNLYFKEN